MVNVIVEPHVEQTPEPDPPAVQLDEVPAEREPEPGTLLFHGPGPHLVSGGV